MSMFQRGLAKAVYQEMPPKGVILMQWETTPATAVVPPIFGPPEGEPPSGAECPTRMRDANGSTSATQRDPVCWQAPSTAKEEIQDEMELTGLDMITGGVTRKSDSQNKMAVKSGPAKKRRKEPAGGSKSLEVGRRRD